ncbi:MAG TPA: Rab family GTPase [Candidatus Lokiarchaeia archaeon]|nr:Rab family GTPase [Candidatus Lokiarchaeia archaeon]
MAGEPAIAIRDRRDKKSIPAKIIIIGDPVVGKTSLIKKYVKNQIESEYMPTVGAEISHQPVKLMVGSEIVNVSLMIWDIAGQKQFKQLRKVYYNGAKGIVLVFDLTNPQTLASIQTWYEEAAGYNLGKVPMILVGNKNDLVDERQISQEDVDQVKAAAHISDYVETSAVNGEHVTEMFYNMAERIFAKLLKQA